jgi:thymidylate synthase (FAD)
MMNSSLGTIRFTSEITVEPIQQVGSDLAIVRSARVSVGKDAGEIPEAEQRGLINFLMANRHGSPFEHGSLTVRVHAPICVFREWHRHRIGWSYNEESGRYKDLEPVFYIPPRDRLMIRPEGFKSSRPSFDVANDAEYAEILDQMKHGYLDSYDRYLTLLNLQCDRGLARDVLGVGIYSSCYCTANPRSIMALIELRTGQANGLHPQGETASRPSKPLYEIEVAARELEALFASYWPITHAAWVANGRMAP